jgi:glycosyltransferase involved in cell wall biosynthesis
MNIGIDGRMIGEKMHGIARYTINILKNILNIDKTNRYTLLITDKYPYKNDILADNLSYLSMKSHFVSLSEPFELYNVIKNQKYDIFHSPSFIPPFYSRRPFIMTLHDMNHLINSGLSRRMYYKFIISPYVRKAKRIITVSELSKSEICRAFGLENKRVLVIYNGVEERFRPVEYGNLDGIKKRYNLPEKFILSIGNERAYKNIKTLLKAMNKVVKEYSLVLNLYPEGSIEKETIQSGLADRVHFIGHVDDRDLPLIYNAASVFVFVSLNEGFGLPPLEAMASGCPAVVSNTSSLPEICGDGAYYVDPNDEISISSGINKVIQDLELRSTLIRKGLGRAKLFSWERAARQLLSLYQEGNS